MLRRARELSGSYGQSEPIHDFARPLRLPLRFELIEKVIIAAILVLYLAAEFSDRLAGVSEYYSLILFALAGMLFAASSNDFAMSFNVTSSPNCKFIRP